MKTHTSRKMNKLFGLFISLLLMACMIPGAVFADNNGTITASGIEKGATVKAYKIVQQKSNGEWEAVISGSINDPTKPTAKEITDLAKDVSSLTEIEMMEGSGSGDTVDYTRANLGAGMYLVLVKKTNSTYVYNPMIISVNYDANGKLDGGSVNADSQFQVGEDKAYAKRSQPTVDKKITGKTSNDNVTGDGTSYGDTTTVGEEVTFEITTTIPAYSGAYDNDKLKFEITDTVSKGLDKPYDIKVFEGSKELTSSEYTLTQPGEGKTFTIAFKKAYLLSDSAKNIKVTYKSKLNGEATSGFDANTNTAKIEYSNNPSETTEKEKKTFHYTFDIDGNVFGSKTGREIVKVGVDATTGELITKETDTTITNPLKDAKFGLFRASDNKKIAEAYTDKDGLMTFKRLDAGEYYLKEIQAPAGYKTNPTEVPVSITAVLNEDGTLKSYSVKINGQNTTTYTGNYDGQTITTVDHTGDTSLFNNYKAGVLPSTGGSGVYFYIIAGIILIGLAAAVYLYSRRREVKEQK